MVHSLHQTVQNAMHPSPKSPSSPQSGVVPVRLPYGCTYAHIQVFRLSHVVLAIIGISTFWYLQKLLEILHLKVQKSYEKAKFKTKLKVKKVLYCDSLKTTGFIRVKLWKLFKECHFFPQEKGCFAQNNYFLWKEYVMGHKSFLKWQFFCNFSTLFLDL